jgi:hypothetical protein
MPPTMDVMVERISLKETIEQTRKRVELTPEFKTE